MSGAFSMWLFMAGLAAQAQQAPIVPRLNAQLYRPVIDARSTLWTESAGSRVDEATPVPRIALHYVNRPLVFVPEGGGEATFLVSDVLQLDAIIATAIDRFRFALDVPVYLYSAGQVTLDGPGIGDIAFDARAMVVDPATSQVGFAVSARIGFPSATVEVPLGDTAITGELVAVGEVRATDALTVLANVGTRINPTTPLSGSELDDQFVWRTGAGYAVDADGDAGLSLDLAGRLALADPLVNPGGVPVEVLAGAWRRVTPDWVLRAGLGRGLTTGIGSPQLRAVVMVTLDPPSVGDSDLDGLADPVDACPAEPEDVDGHDDSDGCPDLDNDLDGLVDAADRCPDVAEDLDGFEDADGCPEADPEPVAEGTLQVMVLDDAGAPIPEVVWTLDGEPMASLVDGFAEITSSEGEHMLRAEAPGFGAEDRTVVIEAGELHDEVVVLRRSRVKVTLVGLDISERIYFETGQSRIKRESWSLLDEVARALTGRSDIAVVSIEGHTDARGDAQRNQLLSEARAVAVREHLVRQGVDPARLVTIGFGEDRPVDDRNVAEAWNANRRVEFKIRSGSE